MKINYRHLLRFFILSVAINAMTTIACIAEEKRQDKLIDYIFSTDVLRSNELLTISVMEQQPLKIFSYQGFTASIWKDINNDRQWSSILNISHTYEFNKSVSLKSSASASYLKREQMAFIPNYDGRIIPTMDNYDGTISVSLPIAVTELFSIIPTFTYAFPLGNYSRHDLRDKGIANPLDKSSSFIYGGLSLSFSF